MSEAKAEYTAEIRPGTLWKHFKGGVYRIVTAAEDCEDLSGLVVYRSEETGRIWVRKLAEFAEALDPEKYPNAGQVHRFEPVEETAKRPPHVELLRYPTEEDWYEVKRRALVTAGKTKFAPPDLAWKRAILEARHSPIRALSFSFYLEVPTWLATHLVRHVHAQPYVQSQRNDRQNLYDRNKAPQDAPVKMILDCNAEEWLTICHKRLCFKSHPETRAVVLEMCRLVSEKCPEFTPFLVPACIFNGGRCHEMKPCGLCQKAKLPAGGLRENEAYWSKVRAAEESVQGH